MNPQRLLLGGGVILLILAASVGTPADADLWGHLKFGRDIVASRAAVQTDEYSFTSDRPWINHEWLSEVSFDIAYRAFGPAGLVLLKCAVITALLSVVWWYLARLNLPGHLRLALVALTFVSSFWRTHSVRPQLFSVLLFAALVAILSEADRGRRRLLLLIPPMMALWVNFHGGWIVGLGVLGLWVVVRVFHLGTPAQRLMLALLGIASVSATLVNPFGLRMWSFLYQTVGFGRDDIEEWGSILTHPLALGIPWLLTVGFAGWALWRSGKPRHADYLIVIGGLAMASFRVNRLDAFFGVAVVLLCAPGLARALERSASSVPAPTLQTARATAGVVMVTLIVGGGVLASAAATFAPYVSCVSIGGPWAPEPEAAEFILTNHLRGRMLTWFDWGEYAIWHFGPDLQVSMDGRRETVYTNGTIFGHRRFYSGDETTPTYLRQLSPDYIWIPKRLPVAAQLPNRGWSPVFSGTISLVFARTGAGPFQSVGPRPSARRCFPGL